MLREKPQISDVIYNAGTQAFEALVTFHDASGSSRFACTYPAPLDMSFEDASAGLVAIARRHRDSGATLSARLDVDAAAPTVAMFTARPWDGREADHGGRRAA